MKKAMKIRDANVYVNGTSTHGLALEISLPEIKANKSEYKALGTVGVLKLFNGFDAMECGIKWASPENDVAIACSDPRTPIALMIRSSRDVIENGAIKEEQPVIYYVKGTSQGISFGTLKSKDDTETDTKLDVYYIKQVVNGEEIVELDVMNNIFRVGGEDLLAQYRENLGI